MVNKGRGASAGFGRREFLGAIGAIAACSAAPSILTSRNAYAQAPRRRFTIPEHRFGRMFPELPPFALASAQLQAALMELGKPGGLLDARDALERGPIDLIVDPELSRVNGNSTRHTAGTTFMGQFIDHDMTFDLTSRLGIALDPEDAPNSRTPTLDLDSLYGGGPDEDPELYESLDKQHGSPTRATKFKIESGGLFEDLPRPGGNVASIADPRNDENLMLAGLHAAFLLFHNHAVDAVEEEDRGQKPQEVFNKARRLTTWHYQWIIVHEVLPLFVGQAVVDDILTHGRKFYLPEVAYIPVEFQGAAYRFGHSMVRPSYRANLAGDNGRPFFGIIFDPTQEGAPDPSDLRGGSRAPRRFIGWQTFFDFGDGNVRPNKLIDTKISTPLFNLPLGTIPGLPGGPTSLPQRNLLRHITWQLPSGQSIAAHMRVPALSAEDLKELKTFGVGLENSTPLWYYILKEAEVMQGGQQLGPVGARIVGEVILGVLELDRKSYLSRERDWKPTLPTRSGKATGEFRMIDFLAFAGVDPDHRGQ
jgi:hypothetical protein